MLFAPNLAWRNVDLKAELEPRVEPAGRGRERRQRGRLGRVHATAPAHDVDDLLLVTVGTGVGGGLVLDGELYRGAFGVGAEIGHLRVVPGGRLCGCGNYGCFEQYASGTALVRNARDAARGGLAPGPDLLDLTGGDIDRIDGPIITDAAREGDQFALEQLAELGRWLGEGIATLAAVLDPAVVAIGGGVERGRRDAARPDPGRVRQQPVRPRAPPDAGDPQGRRSATGPASSAPPTWLVADRRRVRVHRGRRRRQQGPGGRRRRRPARSSARRTAYAGPAGGRPRWSRTR